MRTINLYSYAELSEQAKKTAVDNYRQVLYDSSTFWDCLNDDIKYVFSLEIESNFKNIWIENIYFSLSNCQGDGVSFTGTIDNVDNKDNIYNFLMQVYNGNIPRNVKRVINVINQIQFVSNHSNYCHKYTVYTELVDEYNGISQKRIACVLSQIEKDIEKYRLDTCDELEKIGYSMQSDYFSDDNIINLLENPDLYSSTTEFGETGKMYKG